MYPIILERDTPIIDWAAYTAWCTGLSDPTTSSYLVRSDGVVYGDYAVANMLALTGAITARKAFCTGLHMAGPEVGSEFTPYTISCVAMHGDANVRPFLFMGESPASVTSGAGGNAVSLVHFLAFADSPGTDGSKLEKELTVIVAEKTVDRGLCIGVGMMAGGSAGVDAGGYARLCVRRLVGPGPRVIDTNKQ